MFVAGSGEEVEVEEEEGDLEAGRKKRLTLKQVRDHPSGKQGAGDKHAHGGHLRSLSTSSSVFSTQLICFYSSHRGPLKNGALHL